MDTTTMENEGTPFRMETEPEDVSGATRTWKTCLAIARRWVDQKSEPTLVFSEHIPPEVIPIHWKVAFCSYATTPFLQFMHVPDWAVICDILNGWDAQLRHGVNLARQGVLLMISPHRLGLHLLTYLSEHGFYIKSLHFCSWAGLSDRGGRVFVVCTRTRPSAGDTVSWQGGFGEC